MRRRRALQAILPFLLLAGVSACNAAGGVACRLPSSGADTAGSGAVDTSPVAGAAAGPATAAGGSGRVEIAFLGDSLTAGYGLTSDQSFPSQIQRMFAQEGYAEVEVLNGGVSGDTTAGGLRRIDQLVSSSTRILVVALGGNDALRGLTTHDTHDNLAAIIEQARARGLRVVLAGMEAPTNLGEDYQTSFRDVFVQLSQEYRNQVSYIPFLLEGVAGNAALNQADGIHPTAEGARLVAEHIYPALRDIVDQLPRAGG